MLLGIAAIVFAYWTGRALFVWTANRSMEKRVAILEKHSHAPVDIRGVVKQEFDTRLDPERLARILREDLQRAVRRKS